MSPILVVAALLSLPAGVQSDHNIILLFEGGSRSQFSERSGVLTLRRGAGRLRSARPFSDFSLGFDFRLDSADSEAAVFIRTLTGGPGGTRLGNSVYEIRLSDNAWTEPSAALRAVKGSAVVKSSGHMELGKPGEWQRLHVLAVGPTVTLTLNGSVVAAFEVEDLLGHILFQTRRGAVELRNIAIVPRGSIARPGADGVSWPKLVREVKPYYPADAMSRGVQGIVEVEALILTDGSVGAIELKKPLDPSLDSVAVTVVWQWTFTPAMQNGVAVPVLVPVEVSFTLKK